MRKYRNYTDEDVVSAVSEVKSMSGLLRKLDLRPSGGNFANMKRTLQELGLTCDHWTGQAWNKDSQLKDWKDYTRGRHLKPHLITYKGHKCELCSLETWLDQPIMLEVHHVDGNRTNNSYANLMLLCCNCHATTDNWRNKKRVGISNLSPSPVDENKMLEMLGTKRTKKSISIDKFKVSDVAADYMRNMQLEIILDSKPQSKSRVKRENVKRKNKYTSKEEAIVAVAKGNERASWPSNEELAELVWEKAVFNIAKELGVTDNAVRHRCKHRFIAFPPPGYWAKLKHGYIEDCEKIKADRIEEMKQKKLNQIPRPGFEPGNP